MPSEEANSKMKNYNIINTIGKGAYSNVYKVKRKSDDQIYALKKVLLKGLSKKEKENALNEVRILASVQHPNIISYKECFLEETPAALCIIMEYCDGGDLYQKIVEQKKNKKLFSEGEIWETFIQIVKGLNALHNQKILHRDLKWANIFMNNDGTVKLGDLNVSKVAKMGLVYTQTGTPYYASPEVWKDKPYDNRSDIWSLGCVIYEMITLRPPFTASSMQELASKVKKGSYPKIPSVFSRDLSTVVATLLKVSPSMRPSCEQILHMPAVEEHLTDEETKEIWIDLLNTIKIPRNMSLLQKKLPASQFESDKVEEDLDEDNYEDDFERPEGSRQKQREKRVSQQDPQDIQKPPKVDRTERVHKRPKGLPPTAPSQRVIPPMPQSNRNRHVGELNISPSKVGSRNAQSRKNVREYRAAEESMKKKRKYPKTMEAQSIQPPPINKYNKKYRMYSRDGMGPKKVSEIYRMRAKEVENQEKKMNRDLRNKYQDKVYNANNKYLSRDYASINKSGRKNLDQHQQRILIDPTQNAQKLNQMIGQRNLDSQKSQRRRYQPLSENYRGINSNKELSQRAGNHPVPTGNPQYNLIGKAGARGGSSMTPHSQRKEIGPPSRLKENYKNSDNLSRGGYYVPNRGLNKYAGGGSQRSQPVLGGLKNSLSRKYVSNHNSTGEGRPRVLPPSVKAINQRRIDLGSAKKSQKYRMKKRHQHKLKPMSAKAPSWWG